MKKSNALMLSYIIFLFITVVANLCWKWEELSQIALAASAAGLLFAFADLAGWYLSCALPYAELFLEEAVSIKENVQKRAETKKEAVDNLNKAISLVQPYLNGRPRLNKIVQDCEELRDNVEEKAQKIYSIEEKAELLRKKAEEYVEKLKKYRVIELGLACLGFLTFFVLTVFDILAEAIASYEAAITVLAFMVIMLCYYLRDTAEAKIKKDCLEMEAATKARNEEQIDIQEVEASRQLLEEVRRLVERITKTNSEGEGSENG